MNFAVGILIFVLIAAGWWRISLLVHPYAPCRRCRGRRRGRNLGSTDDRWGRCGKCKGSGERLRWGAREPR
jgi:hypothetical protein